MAYQLFIGMIRRDPERAYMEALEEKALREGLPPPDLTALREAYLARGW